MKEHMHISGQKAKEEEASSSSPAASIAAAAVAGAKNATCDGEKPPTAAPPKHRMSRREIRCILRHEPLAVVPKVYEALKQSSPGLTPSPEEEADEATRRLYANARSFYAAEEGYPRLQEWVRHELETKGYVEVDDEWVRREAEAQAVVEELQKKIDQFLLEHPQTEDEDDDDSDYSDEEQW